MEPDPPHRSSIVQSPSGTGRTERREIRTSAKSVNLASSRIRRNGTGVERGCCARTVTRQEPRGSAGSGSGALATSNTPTMDFCEPVW